MLELQNITYILPNGNILLSAVNLTLLSREKIGVVGKNGTGKSMLFSIMCGDTIPQEGKVLRTATNLYLVPQHFGQFDQLTVAEALGVDHKIAALHAILAGKTEDVHFEVLQDDWTIEERCAQALARWKLPNELIKANMRQLSGGEKTKVFLAGIAIHEPDFVLLDEPTNHLDHWAREQLYADMQRSNANWTIISHDRVLLNQLDRIVELEAGTLTSYQGNYDHYRTQRTEQEQALLTHIEQQQKELRKAKVVQRKALERQQKSDARGHKKQEKAGVARIMMNTLRNKAEQSTSKAKEVHADKIGKIQGALTDLRADRSDTSAIKVEFDDANLHRGKLLFKGKRMQVVYNDLLLWDDPGLDFSVVSGDRVHIAGANGAGKSTLLKLFLGELVPHSGDIFRAEHRMLYLDQDYTKIDPAQSVYEQAQAANVSGLEDYEVKTLLARYLFQEKDWQKPGRVLSGGECMRLLLCQMAIRQQAPDMLVLDEPTNNLDLFSLEILTNAIRDYRGTLVVVSHDQTFVDDLKITHSLVLSKRDQKE